MRYHTVFSFFLKEIVVYVFLKSLTLMCVLKIVILLKINKYTFSNTLGMEDENGNALKLVESSFKSIVTNVVTRGRAFSKSARDGKIQYQKTYVELCQIHLLN